MSYTPKPQIYVACLAAYNSGHLYGRWIDADQDAEDIENEIQEMLKASPVPDAEEWEIHDSEYLAGFSSHNLELIAQVAALVKEHGESAVKGFIGHVGESNLAAEIDNFSSVYVGCYKSEADFCESHLGEEGGISTAAEKIRVFDWATLDQYIDWESIANDAFVNSYFSHKEEGEKVHVYCR